MVHRLHSATKVSDRVKLAKLEAERPFKMYCHIASLLLLASSTSAAVAGKKAPAGFVTTKGNVFKLDGKDFYFAGSNAYYFPFNDVSAAHICLNKTLTIF
jgi:hypothetical protein